MKTSPFSTLTQIACTLLEGVQTERLPASKDIRSCIRVNRAILTELIEAIGRHPEWMKHLKFSLTESALVNGRTVRFKSSYMYTDQFFWKSEQPVMQNQILDQISGKLDRSCFSYDELMRQLNRMPSGAYLHKLLVSTKLLRPAFPLDMQEKEPFLRLAQWFSGINAGRSAEIVGRLENVHNLFATINENNTAVERIEVINEIKDHLRQVFAELGSTVPEWFDQAVVFYEDVRSAHAMPSLGATIKQDLVRMNELARPYIHFSGMYDEIVEAFLKRCPGGGEMPLLDFLGSLAANEGEMMSILQRSSRKDFEMANNPARKGRCTAPATTSIYYQICADNEEELRRGNYLMVINKVSAGIGNVLCRFNPVLDNGLYKQEMASWIKGLFPDSKPIELAIGGDWSNLQERFGILDETMQWLGEMSYGQRSVRPELLKVRYAEQSHSLEFIGEAGQLITPVYIGTVPQFLIQGAGKLLLALVNPWLVNAPFGINPRPWEPKQVEEDVVYKPRTAEGRIVTDRAQWVVPFSRLPELTGKESESERMMIVHKWAGKYNMPGEMFYTIIDDTGLANSKPVWLHLKSSYSLEILKKSLKDNIKGILLTEALPSSRQQWLLKGKSGGITTEFVSLAKFK